MTSRVKAADLTADHLGQQFTWSPLDGELTGIEPHPAHTAIWIDGSSFKWLIPGGADVQIQPATREAA